MDQDQVAFVPKLGKKCRANLAVSVFALDGFKRLDSVRSNVFAVGLRSGAPRLPVEAEELMQQACAFKRKRYRRELSQQHTSSGLLHPSKCPQLRRSLSTLAAPGAEDAYCSPHAFSAIRIGFSARPLRVSMYSGRGG